MITLINVRINDLFTFEFWSAKAAGLIERELERINSCQTLHSLQLQPNMLIGNHLTNTLPMASVNSRVGFVLHCTLERGARPSKHTGN